MAPFMNNDISAERFVQIKQGCNSNDFRADGLQMQTLSYYGCKNGDITIKSRHLVDDVHTLEINTQKPFEIIQH